MINQQPSFKCKSTLFHKLDNKTKWIQTRKFNLTSYCHWHWAHVVTGSKIFQTCGVIGVLSPVNWEGHLKLIKCCHTLYKMHLKSNITLKSDLQTQHKHTSSTYILHMHSKPVVPLMLPLCTITHKARRCGMINHSVRFFQHQHLITPTYYLLYKQQKKATCKTEKPISLKNWRHFWKVCKRMGK